MCREGPAEPQGRPDRRSEFLLVRRGRVATAGGALVLLRRVVPVMLLGGALGDRRARLICRGVGSKRRPRKQQETENRNDWLEHRETPEMVETWCAMAMRCAHRRCAS